MCAYDIFYMRTSSSERVAVTPEALWRMTMRLFLAGGVYVYEASVILRLMTNLNTFKSDAALPLPAPRFSRFWCYLHRFAGAQGGK